MTNDARSKLRSMGGIMASSPELMQVAQKFQVGGRVSAGGSPLRTIPTVRQPEMPELGPRNPGYDPKIFRSGTIDPVLAGTRRVAPLSPTQARRNAILERAAVGSPTYGSGAQPFPSSPDMPFEPRVPMGPEAGFPERAADRVIENLIAGEISSLEQEEITVDDLLDVSISRGIPIQELVDMMPEGVKSKVEASVEFKSAGGSKPDVAAQNKLRAQRGLPPLSMEQEAEFSGSTRATPRPQDISRIDEIDSALSEIESRQVQGMFASSSDAADAERLRAEKNEISRRIGSTLAAEDIAMAQPLVPKNLDQATIDKTLAAIQSDPNINPTPEPEVGETDIDAGEADEGGNDAETGGGAGRTNGQVTSKTSKRDLRSRYNEKLELFKEIYGTDDKDEAQDRAMSLAMIGLAIAAGQSPNALTNIAQGAMVGLQGMGAQREAERERERGLKTLALQTAIDQMGAETEAEAEAAKIDLEQRNRLELEEYKARLGAMYGGAGGSRDARNIIDFTQNTYTEALKAASAMTAPDFDPDTETPHQYAMRQAQQASESMGRMFPGYGGLTSPDAPAAPEIPTITTREEYDALPSGTKFMQNGQERIKP